MVFYHLLRTTGLVYHYKRGKTKLYLDKLEQIAQILDIDVVELIQSSEKNICFQIESPLGSVYQGVGESSLLIEIE